MEECPLGNMPESSVPGSKNWYNHQSEGVVGNIQTDHVIETRGSDLMIINEKENICIIVDFSVPYES